MAEQEVQVKFGAQVEELTAAIESAQAAIAEFSESAVGVFDGLNIAAEAFAAVMAGGIFKDFIDEADDAVTQTYQLSQKLGITMESASGLRVALGNVGLSSDEYLNIMQKMSRTLKQNEEAFNSLGVKTRDANGDFLNQQVIFQNAINVLQTYRAGTDRNQVAIQLFGGKIGDLTAVMRLNTSALQEGSDEAKKLGLVFGEDTVKSVLKYKESVALADEVSLRFKIALAQNLQPALVGLSSIMAKDGPHAAEALSHALEGTLSVMVALYTGISSLSDGYQAFFAKVDLYGQYLANVPKLGITGAADEFKSQMKMLDNEIDTQAKETAEHGKKLLYAIYGRDENGKPLPVPDIDLPSEGTKNFAGADSLKGTQKQEGMSAVDKSDLETNLELYKLDEAAKKASDQAKVDSGHMTNLQMLADLKSNTQQEEKLALDALKTEQSYYAENSDQWRELENKKLIVTKQYSNQIAQIETQTAKASYAQWDAAFNLIDKDFDTMLTGVLQGTQTWQQAIGKMFDDMAISAVEAIAKILLKLAALKIMEMITGTSGIAAAGGVMSIISSGFGIPSHETGTMNAPGGLSMLHPGEIVVPPSLSDSIRSGSATLGGTSNSGQGATVNISLNAIDTQTGSQFLMNNMPTIAKGIATSLRNNNSNLANAAR